jgi:dihydropteroate synthase
MRIIQAHNIKEIKQIMHQIKVDNYGIKIMAPKAITHLLRINSLSSIAANILKQEMLSLGGDVAIARDALTGKIKKTDCLAMGNLTQFNRLNEKLRRQPFGLNRVASDLSCLISNYQKDDFLLRVGNYKLNLSRRPHIMGIVNLTPDSFSGDGLYQVSSTEYQVPSILDFIEDMVRDGADIIDIGGESTRPAAKPVSLKEELKRVIPVIKKMAKRIKAPISIDTRKPEVARQALDSGALMVNDITGLKDAKMLKVIAKYKAGAVIMHMKGNPRTMQKNPAYASLMDEIIGYLASAIDRAQEAGIKKDKIIIDPGIGFSKTPEHNLEILRGLSEFKVLGCPILVGPSRKSFIGKILDAEPQKRVFGSVAAVILAVRNGAQIVRVHDVKPVSEALKVTQGILKCGNQ